MDKISMINKGSNHNNSSYYDKDEEIKIHFYDEQSFQNRQRIKEKINKINKKMNDIGLNNKSYNTNISFNNIKK